MVSDHLAGHHVVVVDDDERLLALPPMTASVPPITTVGSPRTTGETPAACPVPHRAVRPPIAPARWWRRSSLVARFTVVSLPLILGVGLLAAQVVAAQLRSIALSVEAEAVADTVESRIEGLLRPEDLQRPLSTQRMAEIDRLVNERAMGADTVGVSL